MTKKMTEEQREGLLQTEESILNGMLEAANFKNNENEQKLIELARDGKLLFSFRVRPLSEEDIFSCRKLATKMIPHPQNKKIKIEGDIDLAIYRSYKILKATVDEDSQKTWCNKLLHQKIGVINPVDSIDKVLKSGEKEMILNIIDEISGESSTNEDGEANETPAEILKN